MAPLRPVIRWAMTAAYDGMSSTRRGRGWTPDNSAINALIIGAGDELRSKARDSVRRNAWARNASDALVANVIGTGIIPQSKHPDPKIRENLHALWLRWTDESDSTETTDFYGQQSMVCREVVEAGEIFARLRPRRESDGLSVPLQIQLLEGEHVPLWKNEMLPGGFSVRGGIEFNAIGRRVAYHMYPEHPSELLNVRGLETKRIDAAGVMHVFKPLRAGQHRGEPWLATTLALLNDLEKYESAELMRKQMAAMMAFFITKLDPAGAGLFGDEEDVDGTPMQGIEPGSVITLDPNEDVKISEPADLGGQYEAFWKNTIRKFAAGMGLTYEQVSGDYAGVTYSSCRSAILEFRRRIEPFQHQVLVYKFCRPTWKAFIDAAALAGKVSALDYARRPQAYLDVEWSPQAWPWVDPLKDVEAEVLAIDNLLKSRTASIKSGGRDAEDVDAEIAADQAREEKAGLKRGKQGQAPPDPGARRRQIDAA